MSESEPQLKPTPDQAAAHELLSELRTRISTQPLPYQYGIEASALESLWEVFAQARTAMKNHPGCCEFADAVTTMLNIELRPITAKWHRAHLEGRLKSRDGADEFRADIEAIQEQLRRFASDLHQMAYGRAFTDKLTGPAIAPDKLDSYFEPVQFGIPKECLVPDGTVALINAAEAAAIQTRRRHCGVSTAEGKDGIGLAFSGGGIRSATFCLGVAQVLAQRELLKQVDFLSTVSGGGYVGSFLTTRLGRLPESASDGGERRPPSEVSRRYDEVAQPHGPDTGPVRYLRQHAKYLSAINLKQRWSMVTATLAGMLLNWTAPLSVLALAALVGVWIEQAYGTPPWATILGVVGAINVLMLALYAFLMRFTRFSGGTLLGLSTAATVIVAFCWFLTFAWHTFKGATWSWSIAGIAATAVSMSPAVIRFIPVLKTPAIRTWVLKGALYAAGVIIPIGAIILFFALFSLGLQPQAPETTFLSALPKVSGFMVLSSIVLVLGFVALFLLNVNLTAPHRLYRDQLAKTFIQEDEAAAEPFPLYDINPSGAAPYHLINTAVNLPSSTSAKLRERKTDFFLFSKDWCGAPAVGYYKTKQWISNHAPVDLATAMAVSGAAASPYMGLGSMPSLTALLTFLNVRLGFWISRPGRGGGTPGFLCLMKEMTGIAMSERHRWLNLSDGGHIENMGVYELLRRRCKFIISVDGEADPRSTFQGHLTLVRHAQIDFGIRIEPSLNDLRPDLISKFSQRHAILCRVQYPELGGQPASQGLILYIKLSVTGNELEMIKRYRNLNPDFPHQTTLDQFFDEEQFEVYRQLGVHVAEGLFSRALMSGGGSGPTAIRDWFRNLARNLLEPEMA